MFKRTVIASAVALAVALPGIALAEEDDESYDESYLDEIEYYGYLKNETSWFTRNGTSIGAARNQPNESPTRDQDPFRDNLKFESSARLFLNGPVAEESSWHLDLRPVFNTKGANGFYKRHQSYTQNDWFREGYLDTYVDTPVGPLDLRVGKQQEVWGTADGIKLLDIVNPTDYREFVQNTMEDSRITVFMAKAELAVGETDNLQLLVAQPRHNQIPGLSKADVGDTKVTPVNGFNPFAPGYGADNTALRGADRDQPFISLGADSITGGVNGFRNVTPALGAVSSTFNFAALGAMIPNGLAGFTGVTVNDFVTNPMVNQNFGCGLAPGLSADGGVCLSQYANLTNDFTTNLIQTELGRQDWDPNDPRSAFEYLSDATFATFNTFVGAKSSYRRNHPSHWESADFGTRYKGALFGGSFNYSVNYLYAWDKNPAIRVRWKNDSGENLKVNRVPGVGPSGPTTTITLSDSQGNSYGAFDPNTGAPINRPATLDFEETVHRVHNIGGSFDSSFDVGVLTNPLVVRGEFLYQDDVRVPEIDRNALRIGDITNGLLTKKADFFKYVIGLDFLVWTNLTVSTQFIQFYNMDYEDRDNGRYTADPGTLHLTNGLQDGQEYDNYYSLFLSKPFGDSQLGRFNNIILHEQGRGGGWWNRMDVEYQFTDEFVGSLEWNQYWGDRNSLFGQFEKASNFQVGVKYLFE